MPVRPTTLKPTAIRNQLSVQRQRPNTNERGYDIDWQRLRKRFLVVHPLCVHCERRGVITPARVVNHVVDIRDDPDKRLDEDNLESLCVQCHNRHTRRRMNEMERRFKR